ncbi:MAG: DUF255 domain-containing protein [Bacillota bacterium]
MALESSFHFSPRPNRAAEIRWREWGDEAFAEALVESKPVLLAIGAVWCHWCHVMDETSYSDPEVIRLLNEHFIPVRVDTDRRPDINVRYNMGGWPTTALLTPTGRIITGGTYVPPERLKEMLLKVLELYRARRDALRKAEMKHSLREEVSAPVETLDFSLYRETVAAIKGAYDPIYGGFGRQAKFPLPDALELALLEGAMGDKDLLGIAVATLKTMAGGGLYDPVEGGFFRYSTSRDWRMPHYEKMLEDNARLVEVYLQAASVTRDAAFLGVARDVLHYLEENLYNGEGAGWGGSQDADEEYYCLTLEERRARPAPYIDRTVYVGWNGLMARTLCVASWVLREERWARLAAETVDFLWKRAYDRERGLAHFVEGEERKLFGRLEDQMRVGRACLALYQTTGAGEWLDRSQALVDFCLQHLRAPNGALYDGPPDRRAVGALAVPVRDLTENAAAARWFLEQAALTGRAELAEVAGEILRAFGADYKRAGLLAAGYALAVYEATVPWTTIEVRLRPQDPAGLSLHEAALASYLPAKVVRPVAARPKEASSALVCRAGTCLAPATQAAELESRLEEIRTSPAGRT